MYEALIIYCSILSHHRARRGLTMPGSCSNRIGSVRIDKNHQQTGTKPTPLRSSDEKYVGVKVGVGPELG